MRFLNIILMLIAWVSFLGIVWNIDAMELKIKKGWTSIFLFLFTVSSIFCIYTLTFTTKQEIKAKRFNFKTEIRQEFLNGQEISRDTVYVFTPKKK
jgi:hypothetical protein